MCEEPTARSQTGVGEERYIKRHGVWRRGSCWCCSLRPEERSGCEGRGSEGASAAGRAGRGSEVLEGPAASLSHGLFLYATHAQPTPTPDPCTNPHLESPVSYVARGYLHLVYDSTGLMHLFRNGKRNSQPSKSLNCHGILLRHQPSKNSPPSLATSSRPHKIFRAMEPWPALLPHRRLPLRHPL